MRILPISSKNSSSGFTASSVHRTCCPYCNSQHGCTCHQPERWSKSFKCNLKNKSSYIRVTEGTGPKSRHDPEAQYRTRYNCVKLVHSGKSWIQTLLFQLLVTHFMKRKRVYSRDAASETVLRVSVFLLPGWSVRQQGAHQVIIWSHQVFSIDLNDAAH